MRKASLFTRLAAISTFFSFPTMGTSGHPPLVDPGSGPDPRPMDPPPTRGSLLGIARFRVSKPFGRRGRRKPMRVRMGRTSTVGRLRAAVGGWVGKPMGGEFERECNGVSNTLRAERMGRRVKPIPFGALKRALQHS